MENAQEQTLEPTSIPAALPGYVLVLAAAAIWATIGPVYRVLIASHGMEPVQVAFWRAALGALLVMSMVVLLQRPALKVAPGDVPMFGLFGVFSIALFYLSYSVGQVG